MIRLAIHDPTMLSVAQRRAQFTARVALFDRISESHTSTPSGRVPQHRLLIGPPGSGKTMLLARLRDEFGGVYCSMPEGVASLDDFWQKVLDAAGVDADAERNPVDQLIASGPSDEQHRVSVWVDGFDRVLESLGDDTWRLREILSTRTDLALYGTADRIPDEVVEYEAPFFDFFALDRLEPLDEEQSLALLAGVARALDDDDLRAWLEDSDRTIALVTLLRGKPRALALCLEARLVQGDDLDVATCLAYVCERSTPTFEHVLASLSPRARAILAGLALHWHPAHAKTIAARLGQPTNTVSTYFDRLSRDGLVEKVALPPGKTNGYQVRDRLFNLWMLLRGPRDARARVDELLRRAAGEKFDADVLFDGVHEGASPEWFAVELREPG